MGSYWLANTWSLSDWNDKREQKNVTTFKGRSVTSSLINTVLIPRKAVVSESHAKPYIFDQNSLPKEGAVEITFSKVEPFLLGCTSANWNLNNFYVAVNPPFDKKSSIFSQPIPKPSQANIGLLTPNKLDHVSPEN